MEIGEGDPPPLLLDENGIAKGGVRTPWVDVPVARTSGVADTENVMAYLFGSGEPFDDATRSRLYPGGKTEYLERFTASLDATIRGGLPAAVGPLGNPRTRRRDLLTGRGQLDGAHAVALRRLGELLRGWEPGCRGTSAPSCAAPSCGP